VPPDGGLALDENPPRVTHLAVRGLPGSGSPEELMAAAGIDAEAIRRGSQHRRRASAGAR